MGNYWIDANFSVETLRQNKAVLEHHLAEVGALYEATQDGPPVLDPTELQIDATAMHRAGYKYDEQIYDMYAEIGAICEAIGAKGEANE